MDKNERIAILSTIFDCPDHLADQMGQSMHYKSYNRGEPILHQGDEIADCHLVIEGRANARVIGLEGQHIQLTTYEPGEIFGAYPLYSMQRADILADYRLETLSISSSQLSSLAKSYADVGSGLARIFAGQLDTLFDRMSARVTLSAFGRVYNEMWRMANEDAVISPAPVIAALAISVQTRRETASRAVSELIRRGILEKENNGWRIIAPRQFEDMIL